jgi:hypothetical protein
MDPGESASAGKIHEYNELKSILVSQQQSTLSLDLGMESGSTSIAPSPIPAPRNVGHSNPIWLTTKRSEVEVKKTYTKTLMPARGLFRSEIFKENEQQEDEKTGTRSQTIERKFSCEYILCRIYSFCSCFRTI